MLLFYMEKYKVSCSGFLPKIKSIQHSCSHFNAFRRITWLARIFLHIWQHQITIILQPFHFDLQPPIQETYRTTTQEQPLVTEYREGIHSRQKRPQQQPPHTRGTFYRRLQLFYTEKYKVLCSDFLPKRKPIEHSCSHYNAFRRITWLTHISLLTWQHQIRTIM